MAAVVYSLLLLTSSLAAGGASRYDRLAEPADGPRKVYAEAIARFSMLESAKLMHGLLNESSDGYAVCTESVDPACFVTVGTADVLVFEVTTVHSGNLGRIGTHPIRGTNPTTSPFL